MQDNDYDLTRCIRGSVKRACMRIAQGLPGGADAAPVLTSFSRAALPADWPLAWAAVPILEEGCAPPPAGRAALGLRSPPLLATLEAHLRALSRDAGQSALASWPGRGLSPEQAFGAVLSFLAAQARFMSPLFAAVLHLRLALPVRMQP